MTNPIIDDQIKVLAELCPGAGADPIANGGNLITIPKFKLPPGWSAKEVTLLFVAPAGYPAAQPDCFWVEPTGLRLENGVTPQNTNDSNPIPGVGPRGTWFSWHVQQWNANHDSLVTYFSVIKQRLRPAR
jgi:hypothetical protein